MKALDVGIILDGSGSVKSENFQKAKEFISEFITHFKISPSETHVGMITYSTDAKLEFSMANSTYHHMLALKNKILGISYPDGWTRTDKALEMASSQLFTTAGGDRSTKPNILIVFTDGKTNEGSKPYPDALRSLQVSPNSSLETSLSLSHSGSNCPALQNDQGPVIERFLELVLQTCPSSTRLDTRKGVSERESVKANVDPVELVFLELSVEYFNPFIPKIEKLHSLNILKRNVQVM